MQLRRSTSVSMISSRLRLTSLFFNALRINSGFSRSNFGSSIVELYRIFSASQLKIYFGVVFSLIVDIGEDLDKIGHGFEVW